MLTKESIVNRLNELNFNTNEYWILTGAALVMHGVRDATRDIDLGCKTSMFDRLLADGYAASILDDGSRKIELTSDMEIFEEWGHGDIEYINGLPILSLKDIIKIKQKLGKKKDLQDIALINQYLDYKSN